MSRRARAIAVLLAATLLAAACGWYAAEGLRVDTDTAALLSEQLPARQAMDRYQRLFPRNEADLVLAVEATTPEQAQAKADALAAALREHPSHFDEVYQPRSDPFFRQHALLYQDRAGLERLSERVSRMQPMLAMLQHDPTLRGLMRLLERIVTDQAAGDELLRGLNRVFESQLEDRPGALSWQRLMAGEADQGAIARRIVQAQPAAQNNQLLSTRQAMAVLDAIAADLELDSDRWPRLRVTGPAALAHEERRTLLHGMMIGAPVVLLLIGGVLYAGLRSFWLVAATLITLGVGLSLTAGFAALAVGRLNLISVAFALLYMGLGVDFAIHFVLRYRTLRAADADAPALTQTCRQMVRTLSLCALTTAIGFLAFVPTAFVGVAELGIIAAGGMIISLLVTLTVLPALLALGPSTGRAPGGWSPLPSPLRWLIERPVRHRVGVLLAGAGVTAASLGVAPLVRFDTDPLELRRADSEAVRTLRALQTDPEPGREPGAFVLAESATDAREVAAALAALPEVHRTRTVFDLIPSDQQAALAQIDQLALLAGPDLSLNAGQLTIEPIEAQVQAIRDFRDALAHQNGQGQSDATQADATAHRLRQTLTAWLEALPQLNEPSRRDRVADLHERVLATLPMALAQFEQGLGAERVTLEALPASIHQRWVAEDGTHVVQVQARGALDDDPARRRFVDAVRSTAPSAAGANVLQVEAGRAIVTAFRQAIGYAALGILIVLLVLLPRLGLAAAVLVPLAAGGAMTVAAMVMLSMPFNFANVIALPLLLGLAVDNGVHMVQRSRRPVAAPAGLLDTTTARGVVFSTLTTLCGFAGLALSPHPGMAGMGQLLSLGLVLIVGCTLILLPAMLHPRQRADEGDHGDDGTASAAASITPAEPHPIAR